MTHKSNKYDVLQAGQGISRRGFLSGSLTVGAALGLGSTMLTSPVLASPKQGGKLRVGFAQGSTSDSVDPATYNNDFTYAMAYGVFNNLTEIDADGSLIPELAKSWKSSPDAKVWSFELHKGIQFHNGKELDAQDVIASINHHRSDQSKSGAKPLLASISRITSPDKYSLQIELSESNADFPFILSDYHLGIRPAKGDGIDASAKVGTGAYILDQFEPGVRAHYSRNPNYWKAGRAHFSEVEVIVIADAAARQNALMTGEVDIIDRPDLKTIRLLERNRNIRVEQRTGTLHYTLPMHADAAPFSDNNIRLALKHAIDREEMVAKIKDQVGDKKVICALSGGVDSSVTGILLHEAIGDQLTCVFVDHGLLRQNEADEVVAMFRDHYNIPLMIAGWIAATTL